MLIEAGIVDIATSDVLGFENAKNPYNERKIFVNWILQQARFCQTINDNILERSMEIEKNSIEGLDALHLACAEELNVDRFISCDDKIVKKYRGRIKVQNPIELVTDLVTEGGEKW